MEVMPVGNILGTTCSPGIPYLFEERAFTLAKRLGRLAHRSLVDTAKPRQPIVGRVTTPCLSVVVV